MKQNIKTTYFTALFLFAFLFHTNTNAQNIAIEQDAACINCPDLTADPSAALEVRASDKGVLVPRVANTSAISNPAEGLVVYDNSDDDFKFYDGAEWQSMGLKHISIADVQNTFLGVEVGASNTTGNRNTATGYNALYSNTDGFSNTATGNEALLSNTTGDSNTANGSFALYSNTTGILNNAIGRDALYANTSGNFNMASGAFALSSNTTGSQNVAVGNQALRNNTTGSQNTSTGYSALRNNTIGNENTAVGIAALDQNTTGSSNTAIGRSALLNNTTGDINTAVGRGALNSNTTGSYNTAVGWVALNANTTGSNNTAVGRYSLDFNTTGNSNSAVGYQALFSNTTGSLNTAVGHKAFFTDSTFTNSTALGYQAQPTGSNQVRLGNTSITEIGGYTNWTNVSDARFKKQVQNDVPGLAFISLLSPVTYQMDMDAIAKHQNTPDDMRLKDSEQAKSAIRYTGFLAQDVEKAAEAIGYDFSGVDAPQHERDNYSLRYAEFVVPLVKAVQELDAEKDREIADLQQKNAALGQQNIDLEARLSRIETMLNKEMVSRDED